MMRYGRKNERRRAKLLTKLQKAGAIHKREEVESLPSWNRRFKKVCNLRYEVRSK